VLRHPFNERRWWHGEIEAKGGYRLQAKSKKTPFFLVSGRNRFYPLGIPAMKEHPLRKEGLCGLNSKGKGGDTV